METVGYVCESYPVAGDTDANGESATAALAFAGTDKLITLLGELYRRPRFGDRPRQLDEATGRWKGVWGRDQRQARQGLPMVNLVRPDGPELVLTELAKELNKAQPHGVRHARVTPSGAFRTSAGGAKIELENGDVPAIRDILISARNGLINHPNVRGSQLRFPLFSLVVLLMNRERRSSDLNLESALLGDLQQLGLYWRFRNISNAVKKEVGDDKTSWKLIIYLIQGLTWLFFRAAVTGRVPVLSGRYRWFLRQPHLAPEMSGTFTRFATRLTKGEWEKEAPEYTARLLVNTFLEDLRRAYRLRPWQLLRRRRMTYPVLLLDDATPDNGGYALLRLVNDVRNQVGAFDPLLVVSSSVAAPPTGATTQAQRAIDLGDTQRRGFDATDAYVGYNNWQNQLLKDRRARQPTTWYLPIWLPGPPTERQKQDALNWLGAFPGYSASKRDARPLAFATVWLRLAVVVVVLAGAAGAVVATIHHHCASTDFSVYVSNGECVGYSDGSHDLFQPSDVTIAQVEQTIHAQNLAAEQLHAANPARPYITIADVQALTSSDGTPSGLTADREGLEGVAVAQSRQLNRSGTADPIVRVLIGNAGYDMRQGAVVARQLGADAQADPSLVGVVGLDMSSAPTVDTINALAGAGLPMVAATLTDDELAAGNPMYFQVTPQNSREAGVAAAFAEQHQKANPEFARTVRVYYSDDATDTYSANLRDDVLKAFAAKGFAVSAVAFTPSGFPGGPTTHQTDNDELADNAHAAGQDTCAQPGYVFFAGRGVPDYGDFLDGATQCASRAVFLGGDDVTRFAANSAQREQHRALSYYYVSLAPAPIAGLRGPERDFYADLDNLFPFERDPKQDWSLDGHAALSYDAALVLITATEYLRQEPAGLPITPGDVWREITDIHTPAANEQGDNNFIEGVTGAIDYGGDITRHVPRDKTTAILQVTDGEVQPALVGFCGDLTGQVQSAWCPQDPDRP